MCCLHNQTIFNKQKGFFDFPLWKNFGTNPSTLSKYSHRALIVVSFWAIYSVFYQSFDFFQIAAENDENKMSQSLARSNMKARNEQEWLQTNTPSYSIQTQNLAAASHIRMEQAEASSEAPFSRSIRCIKTCSGGKRSLTSVLDQRGQFYNLDITMTMANSIVQGRAVEAIPSVPYK